MTRNTDRRAGTLVAAGLGVAVALWALVLVDGTSPPDSDESHHIVLGLKYQRDVAALDPLGLARHSLSTGRYPFLHGWYLALLFVIGSPSLWLARASSAVLLGASAFVSARLVQRLRSDASAWWSLLPAATLAFAPECLGNAVLAMLEIPGTFLTLLVVWLYLRHEAAPSLRSALAVGAASTALLFIKYPYGAYVCAPVALSELVRLWGRWRKLLSPVSFLTWAPPITAVALWLAIPQSRSGLLGLLADAPDAVIVEVERDPFAIPYVQPELVLYYVRTMLRPLSAGWVPYVAVLFGALVAVARGRWIVRSLLAGIVLWTLFTLTLSYRTFGVDRFLVPIAGVLAVLGTIGLADCAAIARRRLGRAGVGLVTLVLVAGGVEAAWHARDLPGLAQRVVETGPAEGEAVAAIVAELPTPSNTLFVGSWDQLSEGAFKTAFLLAHPELPFEALDVKTIAVNKIPAGTRRLDRWFDVESRWAPAGESARRRHVVFLAASSDADVPFADRAVFETNEARARERVAAEGGRLVHEGATDLVGFEIWELTPAR